MPYTENFKHADEIIQHFDTFVPQINNGSLRIKFIGFVAVAAVTVYELAIKEIFFDFAKKQHILLENFSIKHFERINGKIKKDRIMEYCSMYGQRYCDAFEIELRQLDTAYKTSHNRHPVASYSNIILARNQFAHEGKMNSTTLTYEEIVQFYQDGKEVLHALAKVMNSV